MDPTLTLQIPFIFLGSKDMLDPRDEWTPEERYTNPAAALHGTLKQSCPHILVHLGTPEQPPSHDVAWLLRPQPDIESFPNPDGIRNQLSDAESAVLGKDIRVCPMLLQREEIPLSSTCEEWRRFLDEANSLFGTLTGVFNTPIEGQWRMFSLVTGGDSWLRMTLVPQRPRKDDQRSLDVELVKKIMTTFTAFEREMSFLSTPPALFENWPYSRFLEYRAVRQLSKEKADLWKNLLNKKGLTQKRIGTIHHREKLKWKDRFDDEDIACERTKGRRREWWDMVAGTDIEKLLKDVRTFQGTDRKLAISCNFTDPTEEKDTPIVSSISLHSYHSTVNVTELIAYTELISSLLNLAYTSTEADLTHWLESYSAETLALPNEPLASFLHLLSKLNISNDSTAHWTTTLQALSSPPSTSNKKKPTLSLRLDPLHPLLTLISATLHKQRAYIPTFIARYSTAGGFYPTKGKKLYQLMLDDEHRYPITAPEMEAPKQKKKKKRINEGRLEKLGEVRIADAWEKDEDLEERAGKSPGMHEEEKVGNEEFVLSWMEGM